MERRGTKFLRGLGWTALALAALLALAVVVVELVSWNVLKPMIAKQVEAATGRSLSIGGDVSVSLLPQPRITLKDLALENPDWAEAEHMAEVEQVSVTLDLGELLTGQLALAQVDVDQPRVNLERQANGKANWAFRPAQPQEPQSQGGGPPLSVQHLDVTDAQVRYRGPEISSPPLTLTAPSIQARDDGASLVAEATLQWGDKDLRFAAEADSLDALWSEQATFAGTASLASAETSLETSFELPSASMKGLEAQWDLNVDDLQSWLAPIGMSGVDLRQLEFAGRIARDGAVWRASQVELATANSQLTAELSLDTGSQPMRLDGQVRASALDLATLRERAAPEDDASEPEGLTIPVLPELTGSVDIAIDELAFQLGKATDLEAQLVFAAHRIELNGLALDIAGGAVEAAASLTSTPESITGEARLEANEVDLSHLAQTVGFGGALGATLAFKLKRMEQRPSLEQSTLLAHLQIEQATLSYEEPEASTELTAQLALGGEPAAPKLTIDGSFRGQAIEAEVTADPLTELAGAPGGYEIEARATAGEIRAEARTTLANLQTPELAATITVEGDGAKVVEPLLGRKLPSVPSFRFAANVARDGKRWKATDLEATVGDSSLTGEAAFRNGEQPFVVADLNAKRIDLSTLLPKLRKAASAGSETSGDASQDPALAPLRSLDAELDFHADTIVLPDGSELRGINLAASLEDGEATVELQQLQVAGGTAAFELTIDARDAPATGEASVTFEQIDLSELSDSFTPLEERLGVASGTVTVKVVEADAQAARQDWLLPFLGRLAIGPSRLRFQSEDAETDLSLRFETVGLEQGEQSFQLHGEGKYDGAPASLRLQGDPLLNGRDPERPYSLELTAQLVDSEIELTGSVLSPLALKGLDLELALKGPNPQRLSRLAGVPLPELPPYSVSGDLYFKDGVWAVRELDGTVGDSDLHGSLTLDPTSSPPRLKADLRSESLDLDDLGGLIGAPPSEQAEAMLTEQEAAEVEADRKDRFVLPDQPVFTEPLDNLIADVRFRGNEVNAAGIPLDNVVIDFSLDEARMTLEPVSFGIGEGSIDFSLALDTAAEPPEGTMHVEIRGVDLRQALSESEIANDSVGLVAGRGKFWVKGASVAELFGSADGGLLLLMTDGRLDALLVELVGLDAGESMLAWALERDKVQVYCAYLDAQLRSGVARLDTVVVDTSDSIFTAGGTVDFDQERLDVTIATHPKDASVFVARTPLHLGGTFANIEPGVHGGQLTARVLGSATLAAVAGPVAALAPLLDLGLADSSGLCDGLVGRIEDSVQEIGGFE